MIRSRVRLISIAPVLVCILVSSCNCGKRFLFHPVKGLSATPAIIGLAYQNVRFTASDGTRLHGWWVPASYPRGTVLFCHGNAGNISYLIDTIDIYHKMSFNIFVFDYRGFGVSEGTPTEQGTYLDAEAAWSYLVEKRSIKPRNIIVVGRSLGGPIAARLCRNKHPRALILESTFTSVRDLAEYYYPGVPVSWLFKGIYDTSAYIMDVHCPVLVIHSEYDEIVPFEMGEKLFETANRPSMIVPIKGSHNSGFYTSRAVYMSGIADFLTTMAK